MILPDFTASTIKKIILISLGVLIMGELGWAGWVLTQPAKVAPKTLPKTTQDIIKPASLAKVSLVVPRKTVKVGENISVTINISSSRLSDGADIILSYSPKLLAVVKSGKNALPVIPGNAYQDYLFNEVDEKSGVISVSAVNSKGEATLAKGIFGTINFKALAPGTAKIDFMFTGVSDTRDSNIIESKTSKDLLGEVENLELNVIP